jgi:hypothetical protein
MKRLAQTWYVKIKRLFWMSVESVKQINSVKGKIQENRLCAKHVSFPWQKKRFVRHLDSIVDNGLWSCGLWNWLVSRIVHAMWIVDDGHKGGGTGDGRFTGLWQKTFLKWKSIHFQWPDPALGIFIVDLVFAWGLTSWWWWLYDIFPVKINNLIL